jgi:hypothetical protein
MGEKRNVYRLLVGKPEGKRPLGRPRRRCIDNIKMNLSEIGLSVVDWFGLAQDRYRWRALVNAVMNLRVPQNAGKLPSDCTICGLSSGTQLHIVSYHNYGHYPSFCFFTSLGSAVGIATSYGLDDREAGLRVSLGPRIFISPYHPDLFWGHMSDRYPGLFSCG